VETVLVTQLTLFGQNRLWYGLAVAVFLVDRTSMPSSSVNNDTILPFIKRKKKKRKGKR